MFGFLFRIVVMTLMTAAVMLSNVQERPSLAADAIVRAAQNQQTEVPLFLWGLSGEEVDALYEGLLNDGSLPWYMEGSWGYQYNRHSGTVYSLELHYLDPERYDREAYEQAAVEILEQTVLEGMTDVQIALAIHDYLAVSCTYDEDLQLGTEYDAVVGGTAVCQGYAEAYMDLLNRAGVECVVVDSDEMNHAWNQVKIDGLWYHVDVTADDPTPDTEGLADHKFFLISDETMTEYGYSGWSGGRICLDSRFEEGMFWSNVASAVWFEDADTCYLRRMDEACYRILRRQESTGGETELFRYDLRYSMTPGGEQLHYFTFGLTKVEESLYFTNSYRIYRLDLNTNEVERVYELEASEGKVIIGSFVKDGVLRLSLLHLADEAFEYRQLPLP